MYVNKGMSTIKIADELNKREILPPAVYLKIPTYMKRKSVNPKGKYDHQLKGFVYCGECENKATLRCREEKRKNGTVWRATYFISSKRNNYSGLCDCKQISANLIEEVVK